MSSLKRRSVNSCASNTDGKWQSGDAECILPLPTAPPEKAPGQVRDVDTPQLSPEQEAGASAGLERAEGAPPPTAAELQSSFAVLACVPRTDRVGGGERLGPRRVTGNAGVQASPSSEGSGR